MASNPSVHDSLASVSLREFVRHPSMVGSAFPASSRMVRRLLNPINWRAVDVLVEFGPGTGRFTAAALAKLKRSATLIAIETGEQFVEHLKTAFRDDDRVQVVHGSAQDVLEILASQRLGYADCIISGLPFSTLPEADAKGIVEAAARALEPTGILAAYQMRKTIEPLLRSRFANVTRDFEWWNIPPCHLYWAENPTP